MSDEQTSQLLHDAMAYLDGTADEATTARLEAMLREDPAAREVFAALCVQTKELAELMRKDDAQRAAQIDPVSDPMISDPNATTSTLAMRRPMFSFPVKVALAAMIVLAVGLLIALPRLTNHAADQSTSPSTTNTTPQQLATLTAVEGAKWVSEPRYAGEDLRPGVLELSAGSIDLLYFSGASVKLIGPCRFVMTGYNSGQLTKGRVHAIVPGRAHGFTIDAGAVKAVDLGTDFDVEADDDGTRRVQVREGHVRVKTAHRSVMLTTNQLAEWTADSPGLWSLKTYERIRHSVLVDLGGPRAGGAAASHANVFDPEPYFRFEHETLPYVMLADMRDEQDRPTGLSLLAVRMFNCLGGPASEHMTTPVPGFDPNATIDGIYITGGTERNRMRFRIIGLPPTAKCRLVFVGGGDPARVQPPEIRIGDFGDHTNPLPVDVSDSHLFIADNVTADGHGDIDFTLATPDKSRPMLLNAIRIEYHQIIPMTPSP